MMSPLSSKSYKVLIASTLGTLIEWAEFSFYGYLITRFSHLFFPSFSPQIAILLALATFAISYIARPIGAVFFGHMGDKYGRQRALVGSLLLMGCVTLAMGLLPTYQTISITAPTLLVLLRFLQGVAMAGEFMGAGIFVVESDPSKPYFSSSWISTAAAAGMLLGGMFGILVSLPSMPVWAWRLPFLLGFVGCLIGFYIWRSLAETPEYQQLLNQQRTLATPLKTLLQNHRLPLLQTFTLSAFIGIFIYVCNIWWVTYVIEQGYFTPLAARTLATIAQGSVVLFTPVMGMLAQHWRSIPLMRLGVFTSLGVAPVLLLLPGHVGFYTLLAIELLYALGLAALTAPMFKYLSRLFIPEVRYSGQSIGWNLGVAIFGGTAPLMAELFVAHYSIIWVIGYIVISGILVLLLNFSFPQSRLGDR